MLMFRLLSDKGHPYTEWFPEQGKELMRLIKARQAFEAIDMNSGRRLIAKPEADTYMQVKQVGSTPNDIYAEGAIGHICANEIKEALGEVLGWLCDGEIIPPRHESVIQIISDRCLRTYEAMPAIFGTAIYKAIDAGQSLIGLDAHRQDLEYLELEGVDLTGADFRGTRLDYARFTDCNLHRVLLGDISAIGMTFSHCNLNGAQLGGSIDKAHFYDCSFYHSQIGGHIEYTIFTNCSFELTKFTCLASNISFNGCHFWETNDKKAQWQDVRVEMTPIEDLPDRLRKEANNDHTRGDN